MKTSLMIILTLFSLISHGQTSNRIFYGGYNGSTRDNVMDEYDRVDARNNIGGQNLFSNPVDAKIFYHQLAGGYFYKGAVVVDQDWDRVIVGLIKYTSTGNYVINGEKIYSIGSTGYGSNNFRDPSAVAITRVDDSHVLIYVADKLNNRIQSFRLNLTNGSVSNWTSWGVGELDFPTDVEMRTEGTSPSIYVADNRNNRVAKIYSNGTVETVYNVVSPYSISCRRVRDELDTDFMAICSNATHEITLLRYGIYGLRVASVSFPNPSLITGLNFSPNSNLIYAVDKYNSKIYTYRYSSTSSSAILEYTGYYGQYGTSAHQLKKPVAIHAISPMEAASGGWFGLNQVGILEEWSDNSGLKIGYEGVGVTNVQVSSQSDGTVDYSFYILPVAVCRVRIRNNSTGQQVFELYHGLGGTGGLVSYTWDGTVNGGSRASYGSYTIEVYAYNDTDEHTVTQTFNYTNASSSVSVPTLSQWCLILLLFTLLLLGTIAIKRNKLMLSKSK